MKVAFVVQRCGREVLGGAEALCLQIATHMAKHWQVEVITTCARDYMRWENYYSPGTEALDGVTIRRFAVDQERDVTEFDRLSVELFRQRNASIELQEQWMKAQGPMSAALFDFIKCAAHDYSAFVFFGYLYATTYFGLPLVAEKAWLAPLGHDEWPIYLSMWDTLFEQPQGFIFQTEPERSFLQKRFASNQLRGPVVGIGITPPAETNAQEFLEKYQLDGGFLLYIGRVDAAKGCDTMFDNFLRARTDAALNYKLLVIGSEVMPIPFDGNILYLGTVSEREKWDAIAAAEWLVMPSPHESLSIALLEAWAVGRPSIVTAKSDVLVSHCRASNGGLWYQNYDEWRAIFACVDHSIATTLGRQGQRYVELHYTWPAVEKAYLKLGEGFQR